jgi:hypothetical protein
MFLVFSAGTDFIDSPTNLPLDIATALSKNLLDIRKTVIEIDGKFSDVAKNIGAGREQALLLKKTLTENLSEVVRLGGDANTIASQQKDLNDVFGRSIVLNKEYTDDLFATTQVTGKSAKELFEAYTNVGKSVYQVADDMGGIVQNMQLIGVNAKGVTRAVVENMESLSKFNFQNGVQGLADMAAQSAKLRVDMKTGLDFAEKLYDPEAAQDFVQNISNLGIQTSAALKDVNQVRYMALNDPMKLQEELAKTLSTLVDESGNISAKGMQYLSEFSKFSGVQVTDAKKMAISMAEIKQKKDAISESGIQIMDPKEAERLENLLQKGKTGEFEVKFMTSTGEEITKAVKDLTSREKVELDGYLKKQTEVITQQTTDDKGEITLKDLAFIQQGIADQYKNSIESLERVIPNAIAGSLSGEKIVEGLSKATAKASESTIEGIKKLSTDTTAYVDKIIKINEIAITKTADAAKNGVDVAKIAFDKLSTLQEAIKADVNSIKTGLKTWLNGMGITFDMISLPGGGDRFYLDRDGIKKFTEDDTVMATTSGPKTTQEANEYINPKPVEQKIPKTTPVNVQPNTSITDLANKISELSTPQTNETKKVEASFEPLNINFNMNLKIDGATKIDQSKLEETLNTMLKTSEVADQIRTSLKGIQGITFK